MIPKCSNLVQGMILGYPRIEVVLVERSKFKVRDIREASFLFQYGMGFVSMSAF